MACEVIAIGECETNIGATFDDAPWDVKLCPPKLDPELGPNPELES